MTAAGPSLLWDWGPGESRFALAEGGRVVELRIHRLGMITGWGLVGRVARVDPSLDAAFVELGLGGPPGFLGGARALGLSEGMAVPVRVRADAVGAKGPRLAHAPDLPAGGERPSAIAMMLSANPGIVQVVTNDAAALAEARRHRPAAQLDRSLSLDEEIEAASSPVVALPCGGRLIIEQTAALTAMDVDSGAARPADANRQAVAAVARHLRLRGLGGQVVVDFVSGPRGTPYKMAAALKTALADDPVPTHVFGVSPLGLVELTRERRGPSVGELLLSRQDDPRPETVALQGLRRLLAEADARPGARLRLALAPSAAGALAALGEALDDVARRLGYRPDCRADPALVARAAVVEEAS